MFPGPHSHHSHDDLQNLDLQPGHSPELESWLQDIAAGNTAVPFDYQSFYYGTSDNRNPGSNASGHPGSHLQPNPQAHDAGSSRSGLAHDQFPAQRNPADAQMGFGGGVGRGGGGRGGGGGGDGGMGVQGTARMGICDPYNLDALEARHVREEEIRLRDLQRTTLQTENLLSQWGLGPNAADRTNPNPSFPTDSGSAAQALHPFLPPTQPNFDTPDTPNRFILGGFHAHTQTANSGYARWNQPVHASEYPTRSPNTESIAPSSSSTIPAGAMLGSNQPFDRNFNLPAANPNQYPGQPSQPFGQSGTPYASSSAWTEADSTLLKSSASFMDSSAAHFPPAQQYPGPGPVPGPSGIVYPTPPESVNEYPATNNVAYGGNYPSSSSGFGSGVRTGGWVGQGDVEGWGAGNFDGSAGGGTGTDARLMNPQDESQRQQQDEQGRQRSNPGSVGHHNPSQDDFNFSGQSQRGDGGDLVPDLDLDLDLYQRLLAGGAGENAAPPFYNDALSNQVDLSGSSSNIPPHHAQDNTDATPTTIPPQFSPVDPTPASAPTSRPKLATSTSNSNPTTTCRTKREVKEVMAKCVICGLEFAKLLLRGTKKELSVPVSMTFMCKGCVDVSNSPNAIDLAGGTAGAHKDGQDGSGRIDVDKLPWDPLKDGIPPPSRDELSTSDQGVASTTATTNSEGTSSPPSISKVVPHPDVDASKHKPLKDPNRSILLQDRELADEAAQKKLLAPARSRQGGGILRKRNRKTEDLGGPATCDVCLRDLGVGGFTSIDDRTPVDFAIEVICVRCDERYKRCSDCGGGGGVRLGVGKWRAKELFVEGRKTCSLNHTRLAALSDVEYIVWRIRDIPEDQRDGIIRLLSGFFRHTLLSGLAVPEIMETGVGMASNFQEVDNMTRDGWEFIEPTLRKDVEPTRQIRRYLGLRWCKPHPRKSNRAAPAAKDESSSQQNTGAGSMDIDEDKGYDGEGWGCGSINRPGKDLSGFIIAEWDIPNGTYFVQLNVPWATGDAFEGSSRLIWSMLKKVNEDREREIERINREGTEEEKRRGIPIVRHCWTMLFFSRESRIIKYLERRRNFMPIDEYIQKYPDTDRDMFPPKREVYIPREYITGWQVLIRRQEEVSVADWEKRVKLHDKKVRGKPLKAKEMKALEEKQKITPEGMGTIRGGDNGDSSDDQEEEDKGEEEDGHDGMGAKMKRRRRMTVVEKVSEERHGVRNRGPSLAKESDLNIWNAYT